ncbi:DUF1761 domain-containing protein [Ferruginibacter sp.]|nr:DUF1761 domain-containing protein [Ferruginibacter sp.]
MNTEFLNDINWLAVLVAGIAYWMLGALWYSLLFKNKWLEYTKINPNDPEAKKGAGVMFGGSLVMMIVTAIGLAIIVNRLELTACWMSGLKLGAITGLLFGSTAISISYLYEKRPFGLYLINCGYTVLGNIIAAIIICCWQ